MELTAERRQFVEKVAQEYAKGRTQAEVAEALSINKHTMISRLRYYGYRFGRLGKLEPLNSEGGQ